MTAESRLHIAIDCDRGSLIKVCGLKGLNFSIHTPLLTAHDAGVSRRPVLLATHVVVSCGQSTNQTPWAATDVTVVTDTELKLMFQCYLHVLDGTVASCLQQDRPWDNYRRFTLFRMECLLAYVRSRLRATVAVNSVCAGEQCTFVFVHHIVWSYVIAWSSNVTSVGVQSPLLGPLSYIFPFRSTRLHMYWGSSCEQC